MPKLTKRERKKIKELENAKRLEIQKMIEKKARKEAEIEKRKKEKEERIRSIEKFCVGIHEILETKLNELRRVEEEEKIRRAEKVKRMMEENKEDFEEILKKNCKVGNLIKFLIENNPEVNFGDFVLDGNIIYYSTKLNLQKIKKLNYPTNWEYCFWGRPTLMYCSDNTQDSYVLSNI